VFYNVDAPGQHVQDNPKPLKDIFAPNTPLYRQQWDSPLPSRGGGGHAAH